MIDFRYHVVSIAAVLLALGIGIVLGTTTLNGPILTDLHRQTNRLSNQNDDLLAQKDALNNQLHAEQRFTGALAPFVLQGRLTGHQVVLLSAPDVSGAERGAVLTALQSAGATVAADVSLRQEFVDPAQDSVLDSIATRLANGTHLPAGSGVQRAATQLASVLVTGRSTSGHEPTPPSPAASLDTYGQGGLLSVHGDTPHPGDLAVVLGAASSGKSDAAATNAALIALAAAFGTAADATALAAPSTETQNDGVLAAAANDATLSASVSTVPSIDDVSGQVALVFALKSALDGRVATYSSPTAVIAAVPTPSPAP